MMLYLAVTNDEYELPVAVADSKSELARMTGIATSNQIRIMKRMKVGKAYRGRFLVYEVEVDCEEDIHKIAENENIPKR